MPTAPEFTRPKWGALIFLAPAGLQEAYEKALAPIHTKVQSLPWVPNSWANSLRQSIAVNSDAAGMVWRMANPYDSKGNVRADNPPFLDTQQKRDTWAAMVKRESAVIAPLLKGEIDAARAEGDALQNDLDFWNAAYETTEAVSNAPATAVNAVADAVSNVVGSNLKKLFTNPATLAIMIAVGIIIYRKMNK